uniref:NAD(+) kinase n=1 Tax=Zonotrichia albicollis TaxID=44394 RepID=A0A8D2QEI6_ZONAL
PRDPSQVYFLSLQENNMIVYVEKKVLEDPAIANDENFGPVKKKFCTFREDYDDISNQIDFIICLGGDGTLLYASSLFQGSVPPVMAFHLGSLGFLTPFNFENFQSQVTQVIEGNAALVLRSRLKVRVVKEHRDKGSVQNGIEENGVVSATLEKEVGKQIMQYQVRGKNKQKKTPKILFGVCICFIKALPSSVGGVWCPPEQSLVIDAAVLALLLSPGVTMGCVGVPQSNPFWTIPVLQIMLSPDARNTAWVSFDGRKRQEICHGDSISITTSCYPLPSICFRDPVSDWFESLAQCLHWNVRKKQNNFGVEEEEF